MNVQDEQSFKTDILSIPFADGMYVVYISGIYPTAQSVGIGIDTMSIPHTNRSSGFSVVLAA